MTPISPKRAQHLAVVDPPQQGRPGDHAGQDLAHDGRHPDPLGDLGGHLGEDEDEQDVDDEPGAAHRPGT